MCVVRAVRGLVCIALSKAIAIGRTAAAPLGSVLPKDRVGGVAVADILAISLILLLCFLAGRCILWNFTVGCAARAISKV
jgi:hypothetical protein